MQAMGEAEDGEPPPWPLKASQRPRTRQDEAGRGKASTGGRRPAGGRERREASALTREAEATGGQREAEAGHPRQTMLVIASRPS